MPVNYRMDPNEVGPSMICLLEKFEVGAIRVGSPNTNKDGFDRVMSREEVCERFLHAHRNCGGIKVVLLNTVVHKLVHLGESVLALNIYT